jgi:predicted TPR repeat methyltransferase
MDNCFENRPDLLLRRYQGWTSGFDIKGSRVLDLGCQYSQAGMYMLDNGASRYVGVDMNKWNIEVSKKNLQSYDNVTLINSPAESFLESNTEHFDIVFVAVLIHGIGDVIEFFRKLSLLADRIVIETGHPFHSLLKNYAVSEEDIRTLEYNTAVVECHESPDNNHVTFIHSIKYLATLLNRLGFVADLEPYEALKKDMSDIYGFNLYGKIGNVKRYMIVFNRTSNANQITWEDFNV